MIPAPLALGRVSQLTATLPLPAHWCSGSEQQRLASLAAPERRAQFLAGRWLMRQLLAATWGGDAQADWPLSAADNAPPTCLPPPAASVASPARPRPHVLHLSISHSGDWVACAVSQSPVGIDVEALRRPRDVLALGRMACSAAEVAQLAALQEPERSAHFYQLWTLKEAWFKRDAMHSIQPPARGTAAQPWRFNTLQPEPARGAPPDAWAWQLAGLWVAVASPACRWVIGAAALHEVLPQGWCLPEGPAQMGGHGDTHNGTYSALSGDLNGDPHGDTEESPAGQ